MLCEQCRVFLDLNIGKIVMCQNPINREVQYVLELSSSDEGMFLSTCGMLFKGTVKHLKLAAKFILRRTRVFASKLSLWIRCDPFGLSGRFKDTTFLSIVHIL